MDFERLITDISTKFINMASDEIDEGINEALKTIGEFSKGKIKNIDIKTSGFNIDIDKMDGEALNEILVALTETSIDVTDGEEKVRIYCK